MPEKILNIDYHVRRMIVKALNLKPTYIEAAKVLGISIRTLYRKLDQYNIKKQKNGKYKAVEKKKIVKLV